MFRALIADNDPGVNGLLAELVRRAGFEVDVAFDGEEALTALAHGGYSLLVCDLDMPKKDGKEVLTQLSEQHPSGQQCADPDPLVALVVTGFLDDVIAKELDAMPLVRQTFRKPFDVEARPAASSRVEGPVPCRANGAPRWASQHAVGSSRRAARRVAGLREGFEAAASHGGARPDTALDFWGSVARSGQAHSAGSQARSQGS